MDNEKLVYTTALFRGFKRLQDFALDETAHYRSLSDLNKYLNPEDGRKSTAYPGQIVSVYDDPEGKNGVYFVIPGENKLTISERFATISQVEELGRQVETAINNMVIANPEEDPETPTVYYGLETVKIADKTYKLVKAVETEVKDAKNLYAIEIAGVTYNLKTNLDDYVTKDLLESYIGDLGNLDKSLSDRILTIEKIVDELIDIEGSGTVDELADILSKLESIDSSSILDIVEKQSEIFEVVKKFDSTVSLVSSNTSSISDIRTSVGNLSSTVSSNYSYLKGELEGAIQGMNQVHITFQDDIYQLKQDITNVRGEIAETDKKITEHINNLYGVKRVKTMDFEGPILNETWYTADGDKFLSQNNWLVAGGNPDLLAKDIIEQVSVSIAGVPETFNESDYRFKFIVKSSDNNGGIISETVIDENDIIFDDMNSTFEFSFNKKLNKNINSAAFSVKLPEGALINTIITYVITEK